MSFVEEHINPPKDKATAEQNLRISFCTTCKGRLDHLKETLPKNLEATQSYGNVEFVILAYGDNEVMDWVKNNFAKEISEGRILLAATNEQDTPHFKMAHAKNVAHRLATGDVLCNLDADNYLKAETTEWLNHKFSQNTDIIVMPSTLTKVLKKATHRASKGLNGRIALSRNLFNSLHGYDEQSHNGWGGDDYDLVQRAHNYGAQIVHFPARIAGDVIAHDNETRVRSLSSQEQEISKHKLENEKGFRGKIKQLKRNVSHKTDDYVGGIQANKSGEYGCSAIVVTQRDLSDRATALESHSVAIGEIPKQRQTLVTR